MYSRSRNVLVIALGLAVLTPPVGVMAFTVPHSGFYQDVSKMGEGEFRAGFSGTWAPLVIDWYDEYGWGEVDLMLDYGLQSGDLRFRLMYATDMTFLTAKSVVKFPGLSLEYKYSRESGTSAVLFGFMIGLPMFDQTETDYTFVALAPWIGAVFTAGNPEELNLVVSVRFSGGVLLHGYPYFLSISLATGLDIPVSEHLKILPEASLNCTFIGTSSNGAGTCNIGFGSAVMF